MNHGMRLKLRTIPQDRGARVHAPHGRELNVHAKTHKRTRVRKILAGQGQIFEEMWLDKGEDAQDVFFNRGEEQHTRTVKAAACTRSC